MLPTNSRHRDWILAATVLLSSWLLFQVQPMAGKRILPWFGGGPAVWTAAMLFFQAALLGGYLYAHLTTLMLKPAAQAIVHAVLLAAAVAVLVINGVTANDAWKPTGSDAPLLGILTILAGTVGLPYLLLAASAPLIQAWWSRSHAAGSPYRLYALSNFGSLAALVSYPFAVETSFGLSTQSVIWTTTFAVFALLCAASGLLSTSASTTAATSSNSHTTSSRQSPVSGLIPRDIVLWLALPACASALLLAATNFLCQDIASLPLLWIAPLALYLLTFVVAFDADRWYRRDVWYPALGVASFAAAQCWLEGAEVALAWQVGANLALVFTVGMVCHGEAARRRPGSAHLTAFYLCLALGGALGGLFVALVAPFAFAQYYELPLTVLAAWGLAAVVLATDPRSPLYRGKRVAAWAALAVATVAFAVQGYRLFVGTGAELLASARNFFGVLSVQQDASKAGIILRRLYHGRITHGAQLFNTSETTEPITYYARESGIGQALALSAGKPRTIGVVGLGAGTLAAYAEQGDALRYYEIDPQVIDFADEYFTYLKDARGRRATIEIIQGDARLALERDEDRQFDVLVLDAFSGDSIPVHLLTLEAFELYLKRLRDPGGLLAIHVSNRHLDLARVVLAAAEHLGLKGWLVRSPGVEAHGIEAAHWILLSREGQPNFPRGGYPLYPGTARGPAILWTDDHSSIWSVLKD